MIFKSPVRKVFFVSLALALASPAAASADLVQSLESGDFSGLVPLKREAEKKGQAEIVRYYSALEKFYQGDLEGADAALASGELLRDSDPALWLKNYLDRALPLREALAVYESEHFILYVRKKDAFLKDYAFEALEKAYRELGKDFNLFPKQKVPVEIYPSREEFSRASTLTMEILDRSGAVGICKFRRLMIVSPEQFMFGYRWLDTLSHEYVHYLVNLQSAARCPLWLHEGIAKYLETRWRLSEPDFLTPGNRTELVRALKDDKLIPFARMEPSMVYLDNQEQVRQAFSQVSHAAHAIEKIGGNRGAIMGILREMAAGKTRAQAFEAALKMSDQNFEAKWREVLRSEDLKESPGSAPDVLKSGNEANEVDELVTTDARAHLRLGDRMKQAGQDAVALIQYEKALKLEPNNPVVLAKAARLHLAAENFEKAAPLLERCVKENPNYATGFVLLGEEKMRGKKWKEALEYFYEANALNPFNPKVHRKLAEIHAALGDADASAREASAAAGLER